MRPIFQKFPGLRVPHQELAALPTPVERLDDLSRELGADLWIKRDDLAGGAKARKLEFFVPRARADGKPLVVVGPEGSNWLLGLAASGLPVRVLTLPQCLNAEAAGNRRALRSALGLGCAAGVLVRALVELPRLVGGGSALAPFGGTDPLTTLATVNAAFELLGQLRPEAVYVPLGSGGTAAGLALGFALAGAPVETRAVRITVRAIANERRVRSLAALLGVPAPPLRLTVLHDYVGRGYGHPLPAGERARGRLPVALDSSYSAKSAAAFLEGRERSRLFWLTFTP